MNAEIAIKTPEIEEIWKRYNAKGNKIIYKETILLNFFLPKIDSIENFEIYDDDIWLCGFPKSGTTWTNEMIWNIVHDLNFDTAKAKALFERIVLLEHTTLIPPFNNNSLKENDARTSSYLAYFKDSIEAAKNTPRPRIIKSHLPFRLLPRQLRTKETKAKIVYVWRNPKDACISLYHFAKWINTYTGDFTDFCKLYLNDAVLYMPFWKHVIEFWDRRNEENILILKYEDMKADLPSAIRKTANFLGKNFDEEQLLNLEKHLSFSSMRNNTSVNLEFDAKLRNFGPDGKFIRKGEVGQWKTVMSSELSDQFDAWINENLKNHESLLRELS